MSSSTTYLVETVIQSLKLGIGYEYIVEEFSGCDQRFENAEKILENKVLNFIEAQDEIYQDELYDFFAKNCPRFPTFYLAKKISMSALSKKDFIKINNVNSEMYEKAKRLMLKVPCYIKTAQQIQEKNEKINSVKMHWRRTRKYK